LLFIILVLKVDSPSPQGIGVRENRTSPVDPHDLSIPPVELVDCFDGSDDLTVLLAPGRGVDIEDEDLKATKDRSPF
jgi:hypothetical protein